jgi:hypothetical protein
VDRNAIAQARLNDLEEDLGMSGYVLFPPAILPSEAPRHVLASTPAPYIKPRRLTTTQLRFQHLRQHPLRRLRADASPLQHADHQGPSVLVHEFVDAGLVRRLGVYRPRSELRRTCCLSLPARNHRITILYVSETTFQHDSHR